MYVSWFNSGCLFNQVRSVSAELPGHSHVQHYSFRWSQLPFRLELRLKFQLEFLKNSVAICIDIRNFCQHTRCYQNSSKDSCKKTAVGSGILQEVLKNFGSEKQSTSPFVGYHPTEDSTKKNVSIVPKIVAIQYFCYSTISSPL